MQTIIKTTLVPGGEDKLSVRKFHSNVPGIGTVWEVNSTAKIYGGFPVLTFRTSLLERKFGFSRYHVDDDFETECAMIVALEADAAAKASGKTDLGLSIW